MALDDLLVNPSVWQRAGPSGSHGGGNPGFPYPDVNVDGNLQSLSPSQQQFIQDRVGYRVTHRYYMSSDVGMKPMDILLVEGKSLRVKPARDQVGRGADLGGPYIVDCEQVG